MEREGFSPSDFGPHMRTPSALLSPGGPKLLQEFKEFALRGSMMDLAVGIVLGVAFGRIVTSFVDDILMPPIGLLLGHSDGSNLFLSLTGKHFDTLAAAKAAGAPTLNYGLFFNTVFNFLIVAFAVFLLVKQINRLKRSLQTTVKAPATRTCAYCCSEIALQATRCPHCTSAVDSAAAVTS